MAIVLFGINNCDSVGKARQWLEQHAINYKFHDFRKDGITEIMVNEWLQQQPLEQLINKRSTTWKTLSDTCKNSLDKDNAASLCVKHETLVKRPVLSINGKITLGFNEKTYFQLLTL